MNDRGANVSVRRERAAHVVMSRGTEIFRSASYIAAAKVASDEAKRLGCLWEDEKGSATPQEKRVLKTPVKEEDVVVKDEPLVAPKGRMLYLAYGSNLSRSLMRTRCPTARPLGRLILDNARLTFRSVADIEYAPGFQIPVGVYSITRTDAQTLDRHEGEGRVYDRVHIPVGDQQAMTYMMRDRGVAPPGRVYFDLIKRGYAEFDLDTKFLDEALHRSWDQKDLTADIRLRRRRNPARYGNIVKMPESVALARIRREMGK